MRHLLAGYDLSRDKLDGLPTRPDEALVAIEHTLLTAIWHMITNEVGYTDLGGDYYTRRNPDRTKQRALAQLRQLGYDVTLNALPATG